MAVGRVSRSIALLVAGAVLGGTAVAGAVSPTTTDPVTLCVTKTGGVRVSANDTCSSRETMVQVASAEDVASLATRMDAAEQTAAEQADAIADLQAQLDLLQPEITLVENPCLGCAPDEFGFDVSATGLKPGTALTARWEQNQNEFVLSAYPIQPDGALTVNGLHWTCTDGPLFLVGQPWFPTGEEVVSNTMFGANCGT